MVEATFHPEVRLHDVPAEVEVGDVLPIGPCRMDDVAVGILRVPVGVGDPRVVPSRVVGDPIQHHQKPHHRPPGRAEGSHPKRNIKQRGFYFIFVWMSLKLIITCYLSYK